MRGNIMANNFLVMSRNEDVNKVLNYIKKREQIPENSIPLGTIGILSNEELYSFFKEKDSDVFKYGNDDSSVEESEEVFLLGVRHGAIDTLIIGEEFFSDPFFIVKILNFYIAGYDIILETKINNKQEAVNSILALFDKYKLSTLLDSHLAIEYIPSSEINTEHN